MLYVVNAGDTLSGIAIRFDTTIGAILEANVICNPNLIFPGQTLIIPETGIDLPKEADILRRKKVLVEMFKYMILFN